MRSDGKLDSVAADGRAATCVNNPYTKPCKENVNRNVNRIEKCLACQRKIEKLSQCSTCPAGKYCSRKCFKQDWKNHQPICNSISTLQRMQKLEIRYDQPITPKEKRKLIKLVGQRCMVSCSINNVAVQALWDTSSMVSVVSKRWIANNLDNDIIKPLCELIDSKLQVKTANNTEMPFEGFINADMRFTDVNTMQVPTYVGNHRGYGFTHYWL